MIAVAFDLPKHRYCVAGDVCVQQTKEVGRHHRRIAALRVIQQVAYHTWVSVQAAVWWPLVQFIALPYVVALRIGRQQKA